MPKISDNSKHCFKKLCSPPFGKVCFLFAASFTQTWEAQYWYLNVKSWKVGMFWLIMFHHYSISPWSMGQQFRSGTSDNHAIPALLMQLLIHISACISDVTTWMRCEIWRNAIHAVCVCAVDHLQWGMKTSDDFHCSNDQQCNPIQRLTFRFYRLSEPLEQMGLEFHLVVSPGC